MLGIFKTNRLKVCNHPELGSDQTALYKDISRINHSCAPNCVWSWKKENLARQEVRACREINKGEEILASYINDVETMSQEDRVKKLENWGFACNCQVCSKTGKELESNDKVRLQIKKFHNEMLKYEMMGNVKEALQSGKKKLAQMEIIKSETALGKPGALIECFKLSVGMLSFKEAEMYRKEAMELSKKLGDNYMYSYQKETNFLS